MKVLLLIIFLFIVIPIPDSEAQVKETLQLATLTPAVMVAQSGSIKGYHKHHFQLSALGYLAFYLITGSEWKAALYTLLIGAGKELIYDGALGQGSPLWSDMKWNAFGVAQGAVFTISLKF